MVLVFLSWIYILFTAINFGFVFEKAIRQNLKDFVVTAIMGLFAATIIASTWAIFGRINWEFHCALGLANLLIFLRFKLDIADLYRQFWSQLRMLESSLKILLSIITILIIAQSASIPYVIDNESYYIQTNKWLNEYGLVKGLANLHSFLAQTSGWHIAQSAFSFSFLYKNFNDLSAFCLLLGNVFAIQKMNAYFSNGKKIYLIVGMLPLANIFLFQFISAPSPDIPVYIFSFIIFYYFIERYKDIDAPVFNLIVILVLFSLFIKTTAFALLFIPLVLFLKNFKNLLHQLIKLSVIGLIVLSLFIIKNTITSGFPMFPVVSFHMFDLDYRIPDKLAQSYYQDTKLYGYFTTQNRYEAMTAFELFIRWVTLPKLHGLFNKIMLLLITVGPVFIYKYFNKKSVWVLYFIMCLQMAMLFLSSPQYRFFMNFLLLFCFVIASVLFYKRKAITILLSVSTAATAFVLLMPINLNTFTKNKFVMETSNFHFDNIIFPYKNTKSNTGFEKVTIGNLNYNSPVDNDFLYFAGDGDLPCLNKDQLERFHEKFGIIPQLRTNSISDGFYSLEQPMDGR